MWSKYIYTMNLCYNFYKMIYFIQVRKEWEHPIITVAGFTFGHEKKSIEN